MKTSVYLFCQNYLLLLKIILLLLLMLKHKDRSYLYLVILMTLLSGGSAGAVGAHERTLQRA